MLVHIALLQAFSDFLMFTEKLTFCRPVKTQMYSTNINFSLAITGASEVMLTLNILLLKFFKLETFKVNPWVFAFFINLLKYFSCKMRRNHCVNYYCTFLYTKVESRLNKSTSVHLSTLRSKISVFQFRR